MGALNIHGRVHGFLHILMIIILWSFSRCNVEIELQDLGTLQLQDYDSLCGEKRTYYSVRQMAHKRTLREKKGKQENRNTNEDKDS